MAKFISPDILQIISDTKACSSCANVHEPSFQCKLTYHKCASKVCPMGCEHDGVPLNQHACINGDHTPSFTVSKLGSNRSIPLVESVDTGSSSIGIQYDLGSQLSLISRSTLRNLPPDMYTSGENLSYQPAPIHRRWIKSPCHRSCSEGKQIKTATICN